MAKMAKSSGWLINLSAFIAVILIGISLILSKIGLLSNVAGALQIVAQVVAYAVVSVVSFFYVVNKRKVWTWIIWIVSIVLIVVYYVL